jgi:hypothetical protein
MKNLLLLLLALSIYSIACAQENFTEADKRRGSITEERAWWNLQHYKIEVEVLPEKKHSKEPIPLLIKFQKEEK